MYPDVLQKDSSSPLVLELHQFLGMLALLMRLLVEKLGKVVQSLVVSVKVVRLHPKKKVCGD